MQRSQVSDYCFEDGQTGIVSCILVPTTRLLMLVGFVRIGKVLQVCSKSMLYRALLIQSYLV